MNAIRDLKPSEIQVKVKQFVDKGDRWSVLCLLYKNARVDMAILDEVFGPMGWQKSYELVNGNLFCTVSVWDGEKNMWVSKADVGTESDTEAEKGEASDAFKRACTNWGIGRGLYTGPPVWVNLTKSEVKERNGKPVYYDKLSVSEVDYDEEGTISHLVIVDKNGEERFTFDAKKPRSKKSADKTKAVTDSSPRPSAEEPKPPVSSSFDIRTPEEVHPPLGEVQGASAKTHGPIQMPTQNDFVPMKAYEYLLAYADGDKEILKCVMEDMGLKVIRDLTWDYFKQALIPIADAVRMKNQIAGKTA